jgi:hypothetical protein
MRIKVVAQLINFLGKSRFPACLHLLPDNLHTKLVRRYIDIPRPSNMSAKKSSPIVVSDEHLEVKIYSVNGRSGFFFQLPWKYSSSLVLSFFARPRWPAWHQV